MKKIVKILANKRILLGVCGSIAAYKSAELTREFIAQGAEVRVVMTPGALEFITPLTLQALSGHPVRTALMDTTAEAAMGHIELARWADAVVIAPASANFIAGLTHGEANHLLATICIATDSPVVLVPAMNNRMWENSATQANVSQLVNRGIKLLAPETGSLACGETGTGRMPALENIINFTAALFTTGSLHGVSVLVSAGPTREAIDPVRYLSNKSSGKMGYAIAQAAMEAGADVTLVSGPTSLAVPNKVKCINVVSSQQMLETVIHHLPATDLFVAAAAVADFVPESFSQQKIKKTGEKLTLTLVPAPDILKVVSEQPNPPFLVGFAAETENIEKNARLKFAQKKLDMIAVNNVSDGKAFDQDDNELWVIWENGEKCLPLTNKLKLARCLITLIAENYHGNYAEHTT